MLLNKYQNALAPPAELSDDRLSIIFWSTNKCKIDFSTTGKIKSSEWAICQRLFKKHNLYIHTVHHVWVHIVSLLSICLFGVQFFSRAARTLNWENEFPLAHFSWLKKMYVRKEVYLKELGKDTTRREADWKTSLVLTESADRIVEDISASCTRRAIQHWVSNFRWFLVHLLCYILQPCFLESLIVNTHTYVRFPTSKGWISSSF